MTIIRERLAAVAAQFVEIDVALFTTFTFNADFFEQNVLPALFGSEPNEKPYVRQARVHKGLLSTRVAAFYDASLVKPSNHRFRYTAVPMHLGQNRLFHPKNVIIFGKNADQVRWIYVAAMSANLSIAGWGQNKECFADTWIHAKSEQPAKEIRDYLQWMQERRRSDVLHAAIEAWEDLREKRSFKDPDGTRHDAKHNVRLYFSPLHRSLWSFLKEEYGVLKSVVAGSPYWGNSCQAAGELKGVDLQLVASRCAPSFKKVNLGKDTLTQLYSGQLSKKVQSWLGDAGRFHHLKVYKIQTGRGEFTGLGSCNFTDSGQFWENGNVESMLFDQDAIDLPAKAPLTDGDLPDTSKSEDPPDILPAYVSLQYDWRSRKFSWHLEGNQSVLPARLRIPDGGEPVHLTLQENKGEREGQLRAGIFTFAFQSGEEHVGLVEELNVAESTLVYGRTLPARDILESWRAGNAAEPELPTDDDAEENKWTEGTLAGETVQEPEGKDEPFDWFLFYRCVQDMRVSLERAENSPRLLSDLIVARSDSVIALSDSVCDGMMLPAGKWLVLKECMALLKPYCDAVRFPKGRLKHLKMRLQELQLLMQQDLESELSARRARSTAAEVTAWYDRQLKASVGR